MSENDNTIEEIRVSLEQVQAIIQEAEALNRLANNPDFRAVILQSYFRDEPARLVELKAAANMQDPRMQEHILRGFDAIGYLQQHFNKVFALADTARESVKQGEAEIEALTEQDML